MSKQTYQVTCPMCGTVFDEKSRQCPRCHAANKLSVCRTCGNLISARATRCPACGAKHRKRPNLFERIISVIAIIFAVTVLIALISPSQDSGTDVTSETKKDVIEADNISIQKEPEKFDSSDYVFLSAERVKEFGEYLAGERVITSAPASSVSKKAIKSDIVDDDSVTYDIIFNFENPVENATEGSYVLVAGMVSPASSSDVVSIDYCRIVPNGTYSLENEPDKQQEYCESLKQAALDLEAERIAKEKADYISDCSTPSYEDVARNPDSYEGSKVKISGSVIQVSESFLDIFDTNSVDLRVEAPDGVWYVTYSRQEGESRILEGDYITCYGECDGVTTYISVLGGNVTVPKLIMKYHD